MANLDTFKVNLDTPQPDGRKGESPRSAFTKHNGLVDELKARTDSLGTAATKDVTTSQTDATTGRLLKVGDFGVGTISAPRSTPFDTVTPNGFYIVDTPDGLVIDKGALIQARRNGANTNPGGFALLASRTKIYWQGYNGANIDGVYEIYHTGNTTKDGNGVLSASSPVIQLYADKIESSGFENENPQLTRISKGVYQITGTSGLALEGWYIRSPEDRNGNKYFNVDWEQDITPELNENGYVDEPQNVTLIIRTFERVWNPQSGVHENGSPIDINKLQTRFIALRFNEMQPDSKEH